MGLDPATLGALSLAGSVLGTGVSVLGQMQSAKAQEAQAEYQSQVAANNAIIAQQKQAYASKAAQAEAQQVSIANAEQGASIRAAMAANGIDVNSGSATDVQSSQRETGKLNTLNTIQQGALQQYGYQIEKNQYTAQSSLYSAQASQAGTAGLIGAGGSLLQGASSIGNRYLWMQNNGVFDSPDAAVA